MVAPIVDQRRSALARQVLSFVNCVPIRFFQAGSIGAIRCDCYGYMERTDRSKKRTDLSAQRCVKVDNHQTGP
jgi:hypothetical protein